MSLQNSSRFTPQPTFSKNSKLLGTYNKALHYLLNATKNKGRLEEALLQPLNTNTESYTTNQNVIIQPNLYSYYIIQQWRPGIKNSSPIQIYKRISSRKLSKQVLSRQLETLTFSSANSLVICLIKTCTNSLTLASLVITSSQKEGNKASRCGRFS